MLLDDLLKAKPKPRPRTVSRAPAPGPSIDPGTSHMVDWRSDKASVEEFSQGWDEEQRSRRNRRRI
jgi:hypothetical protein